MKIAFTTCVQLGKSCIEAIYEIGGRIDLMRGYFHKQQFLQRGAVVRPLEEARCLLACQGGMQDRGGQSGCRYAEAFQTAIRRVSAI